MEKDLKVDSNMPLSNSSQEVTKDLLDMIGEYKGHTCPLLGRTGPSRRPLSRQVSLKNKTTLSALIRLRGASVLPAAGSLHRALMQLIAGGVAQESGHFINVWLQ